jgi:L-threonylcarbamoyladenylate synthase
VSAVGAVAGPRSERAPDPAAIAAARERLRAGGLVAFPTETVWGLGADACSEAAMARLRRWKGRDAAQPVAVLVADVAALALLGIALPATARRLAEGFWPGPLTLVVPAAPGRFASGVARGDGAVGLRCSPHPTAAALARALAQDRLGPLTATSLNRHGATPARTRREAVALCADRDAVWCLDTGPDAGAGAPSSVVDCSGPRPRLLRAGAIGAAELSRVLDEEIAAP